MANGTCEAQRTDLYRITAKKGQRLILHCTARQADTRTDAVLSFLDSSGKPLDELHDPVRVDPTLDETAPEDGTYFVGIHDYLYQGGPEYGYRLCVSTGPWIDFVDPPVAVAGTSAQYTVYGRNLPGGIPAEGVAINGKTLEKLQVTIQAPADPAAVTPPVQMDIRPSEASLDWFGYQLPSPAGPSNTLRLALVQPELLTEAESNDQPERAQALGLPAQMIGHLSPGKPRHWFSFRATKGQKLWLEVVSQRLGNPTDPTLLVQHLSKEGNGKLVPRDVLESDDVEERGEDGDRRTQIHSDDPGVLFTAPEDGDYRLLVRDQNGHSDPSFAFVLIVRPPKPSFSLLAYSTRADPDDGRMLPYTTVLRRGGSAPIDLIALRRDGFAGEIHVTARSLPAGVTAAPAIIGPQADLGTIVLGASPDAPIWTGAIELTATATVDGAETVRPVRPFEVMARPVEGSERAPSRLVQQLALAVRDDMKPPLTLSAGDGKLLHMARGGKLEIPLALSRTENSKGEVRMISPRLPEHVRADQFSFGDSDTQKTFKLEIDPEATPGTFSFVVRTSAPLKYARSPEVAQQLAEDKKRIEALVAESNKSAQEAAQARQRSEQLAQEASQKVNQAEQHRGEAERASQAAHATAQQAAEQLAKLTQAAHDTAPAEESSRQASVDQAQRAADESSAKAKATADQLAMAAQMKSDAEQKAKAAEKAHKDAIEAEAQARQDAQKAEEARRAIEEQFNRSRDQSQPRDHRMVITSNAIVVQVVATPFTLKISDEHVTLKAGGDGANLTAQLDRDLGFTGEIRFELQPSPGAGGVQFTDKANLLSQGAAQATLALKADSGAPTGKHSFIVHARYHFGDRDLDFEQPLQVDVLPPDKK